MTEIDSIINNTSISIFFNNDLMQFSLDETMQMRCSITPNSMENLTMMKALIDDMALELQNGFDEYFNNLSM